MSLFVPPSGTIHPLWLMHYIWQTTINCTANSLSNNSVKATSDKAVVAASLELSQTSFDPNSKTTTLGAVLLIFARSSLITLSTVRPPKPQIATSQTLAQIEIATITVFSSTTVNKFTDSSNEGMPQHESTWFGSGHL